MIGAQFKQQRAQQLWGIANMYDKIVAYSWHLYEQLF